MIGGRDGGELGLTAQRRQDDDSRVPSLFSHSASSVAAERGGSRLSGAMIPHVRDVHARKVRGEMSVTEVRYKRKKKMIRPLPLRTGRYTIEDQKAKRVLLIVSDDDADR